MFHIVVASGQAVSPILQHDLLKNTQAAVHDIPKYKIQNV